MESAKQHTQGPLRDSERQGGSERYGTLQPVARANSPGAIGRRARALLIDWVPVGTRCKQFRSVSLGASAASLSKEAVAPAPMSSRSQMSESNGAHRLSGGARRCFI